MSQERTAQEQNEYLQKVLETYKGNPTDDSLTQAEKLILQQALAREAKIKEFAEQMNAMQEELTETQKKLQVLDSQVLFERGQLSGLVEALLALRE